jgi:hypothetical protein
MMQMHGWKKALAGVCLTCTSAAGFPGAAAGQLGYFLNLGAGVSLPTAGSGDAMNSGWLVQTMGGVTLPGGIVNLRVGGTHGQSKVDVMEGGTTTATSVMAGVMLTPVSIGVFVPYALADAGLLRARYRGSATSFAWQAGGGLLVQTGTVGWFLESRYMQARRTGRRGEMIPVAGGVRLMW